jgi:hypothetical protein
MARGPATGLPAAKPRVVPLRDPCIHTHMDMLPRRRLARGQTTRLAPLQGPITGT